MSRESARLSYVQGRREEPLIGVTIGEMFDTMAFANAARDALVVRHQNVRWTYAELRRRVDEVALGLMRLGLDPRDRLGIWSPNCVECVPTTQARRHEEGLIQIPPWLSASVVRGQYKLVRLKPHQRVRLKPDTTYE